MFTPFWGIRGSCLFWRSIFTVVSAWRWLWNREASQPLPSKRISCMDVFWYSTPMNKFAISFKSLDEVRFVGIVLSDMFIKQMHRQLLVMLQKIHKETVPRVLHFFSTTACFFLSGRCDSERICLQYIQYNRCFCDDIEWDRMHVNLLLLLLFYAIWRFIK